MNSQGFPPLRRQRKAIESLPEGSELENLLIQLIRDHHEELDNLSAALQILKHRQPALPEGLARLLQHPDPHTRMYAALACGLLNDPRVVPDLLASLNDPDANTRFNVIEALGEMKSREAVPALLEILRSREYFESYAAVHALAAIGDPASLPALTQLLDNPLLAESAVQALGALGDPAAAPAILGWLARENEPENAFIAASALASLERNMGSAARDAVRANMNPQLRSIFTNAVPAAPNREPIPALAEVITWLLEMEPQSEDILSAVLRLLNYPATAPNAA